MVRNGHLLSLDRVRTYELVQLGQTISIGSYFLVSITINRTAEACPDV